MVLRSDEIVARFAFIHRSLTEELCSKDSVTNMGLLILPIPNVPSHHHVLNIEKGTCDTSTIYVS